MRLSGHKIWVTSAAFSPDGRRAVSGSNDMTLRLRNVESGCEIFLRSFGSAVLSLDWSEFGLVVGMSNGDLVCLAPDL
ncbi:WD domain, G-beta repeat [Pelagimonas phthalicica]|uniref:WD domain, G-beta repeat n=1 Tax=Pelagimonas phthalicica TaxID=1037362 RepID=A0A238JFT9_9RHOB|nr:hypothetical protein [Pelagimonas phthalicica]TDS92450.1 WD domain G-beta repeat uncharacterized protein [Pelagimonas phthalicica]SMX29519.1 WD domain, G-beta repeat [Pelagimonas phthalicica]